MALRDSRGRTISITFEADDSSYQKVAGDVDRNLDTIQKKAEGLGSKFTAAGKAMVPISAALSLAGGVAIKFANDFNRGMANVATLIPGNTKRVQELKGEVQNLSIATGKTTADLTDGLYQTISAFGDTADTAKILGINAKAAAAGLAETTDAINLTSAVTKGYGDTSAEAVQKASDLALMTVRLGQTDFPQLASSMGKVIPIAQSVGQSQEDLFAVFATATGVTGTAAEVATQYRGVLAGLINPTADMTKLIKAQGFESGQAMLQQRGLVGTMQDIVGAAEKSGQPITKYIASIEAVPLALALAGPQADNFIAKQQQLANVTGATDEAFREQTEGVNAAGFKLDQMRQRMEVLAQKVGDLLLPHLEKLTGWAESGLKWAEDAIGWFNDLPEPVKNTALAVGAIAAISAPTLMAIGFGLNAVASGVTAVGGASTLAGGATAKFFGLLSGPVAIGLAAVGTGFLAANSEMKAFQANHDRLAEVAKDPSKNLTPWAKSAQEAAKQGLALSELSGGLSLKLNGMSTVLDNVVGAPAGNGGTGLAGAAAAATWFKGALPGVNDADGVLQFFNTLETRVDALTQKLPIATQTWQQAVVEWNAGLTPRNDPNAGWSFLPTPDVTASQVQDFFDNVRVVSAGEATETGKGMGSAIVSGLGQGLDTVTDAILGALRGGGNVLESAAAALGSKIGGGLGKGIGNALGGPAGGEIGEKIGAFVGSLAGKLFSGNDTKKARDQFAQSMGYASLDAMYTDLRTMGEKGGALVHEGLNVIGKKDVAANNAWISSVRQLIEEHKALAGVVEDGVPEGARGFPTRAQLEDSAKAAGEAYAYMRDSGLYTADTLKQAWQQWQDALVASGDAGSLSLQKLRADMDALNTEYDSVFGSIKAELENPEYDEAGNRIYGVIEAQGIARMEAIDAERDALKQRLEAEEREQELRLEESGQKVLDVAATVRQGIADLFGAAIEVPWTFHQVGSGPMMDLHARTSYAAAGGLVTTEGVHYFSGGGWVPRGTDTVRAMLTPGEFVVNRRGVQAMGIGALADLNAGRMGGGVGSLSVKIDKAYIRDDRDIDALADRIILNLNERGL